MLLGRTLLLGLPDNIDFNRLSHKSFGCSLFLILPTTATQRELVLADADEGGSTPEEENACRRTPGDPEHEDGHDNAHDERLVALLVLLVLHLLEHHRKERRTSEDDHENQVGDEGNDAFFQRTRRSLRQIGDDAVESERCIGIRVILDIAKHLEERDEDGHLEEHGKATHQRIELRFCIELLHFLIHANLVVAILLLDFLDLRLDLLHLEVGLGLLMHEWCDQNTEDDGNDDDGHAPVMDESIEEVDDLEDRLKNYFPHFAVSPSKSPLASICSFVAFSGTGSYPYGPPGRQRKILFAVSIVPFKKPNRLTASNPYSEQVG